MGSKQELRASLWEQLEAEGASRFPGAKGRIPNFKGAEQAAERLAETDALAAARHVKCNPDSPQRKLRSLLLRAGKTIYMAVPRLASDKPFLRIDGAELDRKAAWEASSIKGASRYGTPVAVDEMPSLDAIVTGCVMVGRDGARLGKGGGYSDLEYALLREAGKVTEETPVMSTVHPMQIADAGEIPAASHDLGVDRVATPDELVPLPRARKQPEGIVWEHVSDEMRGAIPVLERLAPQ